MEKNTKGKHLAIGILVLLLVSMIPMAATATPPETQAIREIAYKLDGYFPIQTEYTVECTVGEKVGRIVIGKMDDVTKEFPLTVSFSKLLPNHRYVYVLVPPPVDGNTTYRFPATVAERPRDFYTDERGRYKDVMWIDGSHRADFEDLLNNESYIFGVGETRQS